MVVQKVKCLKSPRGTSTDNNAASVRSRNSVIQGNQIFVWNRKIARSNEAYVDKKYHIPFNPPPNEVNFIGGLGKNRGNPRSKVILFVLHQSIQPQKPIDKKILGSNLRSGASEQNNTNTANFQHEKPKSHRSLFYKTVGGDE